MLFKKMITMVVVGVTAISILNACSSTESTEKGMTNWTHNMKGMEGAMNGLVPFMYEQKENYSSKEQKEVLKNINQLYASSHKLPESRSEKLLGKDPLVKNALENLKSNIEDARLSLAQGNVKVAKARLKQTIGLCFQCHTRTDFGLQVLSFQPEKNNFSIELTPAEKANLLVMSRRYDEATKDLESYLLDSQKQEKITFHQESLLKKYLLIKVKVQKDPKGAYEFLKKYNQTQKGPFYLNQNIKQWVASFEHWLKSKDRGNRLKQAERLLKTRLDSESIMSNRDAKFIEYLRASYLLHEYLQQEKSTSAQKAQVYYLLGVIYERMEIYDFWDMPEVYFESCIREQPNSKIAQKCFRLYEENVVSGFTGSRGTFIPSPVYQKISDLKKLSGLKESKND